jgi:hypothetical protein
MIELVKHYDTLAIVMASEHFVDGGASQCLNPQDAYRAAKHFVELLVTKAGRTNDQIIIDPGLAPVGADTYGLVNIGLDAMRLISADPDLKGVHLIVGLSNFAWGTPKGVREELEKAYLTLGMEVGLDFAICNPEKTPGPLPPDNPMVGKLRRGSGRRPGKRRREQRTSPASVKSRPSWPSATTPRPWPTRACRFKTEKLSLPAATGGRKIWLRVGTLLDGVSSKPLRNAHVVYDKSSILFAGEILRPRIC